METRQINTIKLKIDSVMEKRSIIKKAPVDLFIRMHRALVAKNYGNALNYCNAILSHEQENATMITFHRLLTKKLEMMEEDTDSTDTRSESSSSESMIDTDM